MDELNWDYDYDEEEFEDEDLDLDLELEEYEDEYEATNPDAFYQALKIALQIQAEAAVEIESPGQLGVG